MTPSPDDSHFDLRGMFWRVFWLVFLVRELIVWGWMRRMRFRDPTHRLIMFLISRRGTPGSLVWGVVGGAIAAIVLVVLDAIVVKPLSLLWLSPAVDSSSIQFHLGAGEIVRATMPGRRHGADGWKAGTLLLSDRRVWFIGGEWHDEPWSLDLTKIASANTTPTFIGRVAPVRNWPELIVVSARTGETTTFATADPSMLLAWLRPLENGWVAHSPTDPRLGAFDV